MNPYDAPQQSTVDNPAEAGRAANRRLRWFILPATLSWFFGGLALLALPLSIYRASEVLPPPAEASRAEQWIAYGSLGMITAQLVGGITCVTAGTRWLRGRWIAALILNLIASTTMTVSAMLFQAAMDAALEVPDWPAPR